MIRTLRITGILAVALAAVLVFFSVVFGVRSDKDIEELLGEPDVIEKFNKSASNKTARGTSQVSPLVQQAGAFALYLNPPKPKTPRVTGRSPSVRHKPSVRPKFKVLATSYNKDRPESSIAMIDEPGKGRTWVRQSSKVGHLFIEEIKDGVVVFKDSSGTFELAAEQKPQVSLLEGAPVVKSKGVSIAGSAAKRTSSRLSAATSAKSSSTKSSVYSGRAVSRTAKIPKPALPRKTNEANSVMAEFSSELSQLQSKLKSGEYTEQERAEMMNQFVSRFQASRASRLSAEESERLSTLGKELKKMMEQPTGSGKK